MTHTLVQVAQALMEDPAGQHWGYDLTERAHVRSGALYPVLHRMLEEGWLADGWEEQAASGRRKRPPRRYYKITDKGAGELGAVLARAQTDARFSGPLLRPGVAW